jgi:hypothetical protein
VDDGYADSVSAAPAVDRHLVYLQPLSHPTDLCRHRRIVSCARGATSTGRAGAGRDGTEPDAVARTPICVKMAAGRRSTTLSGKRAPNTLQAGPGALRAALDPRRRARHLDKTIVDTHTSSRSYWAMGVHGEVPPEPLRACTRERHRERSPTRDGPPRRWDTADPAKRERNFDCRSPNVGTSSRSVPPQPEAHFGNRQEAQATGQDGRPGRALDDTSGDHHPTGAGERDHHTGADGAAASLAGHRRPKT